MNRVGPMALAAAGLVGLGVVLALVAMLWLRAPAAAPKPLNTATVIQRVQALSQFVTVKYVLEKVVSLEDPQYFGNLIPLGENKVILLAHGEVKAGVDLSRLGPGDASISGRTIVLTIPPAVVTDAYLVEHYTQVLDWQKGLLRKFDKNLEQTARRYAVAEISRAARQGGIEQEASDRACAQLKSLLESLGFDRAEIRVRAR
jgi:hypothetical protein